MPTYVCHVAPKTLTGGQKAEIATAITHRHGEATGAPRFLVQVIVDEGESAVRYLGGDPSDAHIWIRGDIRAGRSEEVRQQLMLNIMKDVSAITSVAEESIWVYLCNLTPTDMVEYGHVLPKAGEEQAWFDGLPSSLQKYLTALGASKEQFRL